LPVYAERFHATPFEAGALIAVYSLMQLVFAPVWGRLSDQIGRRPVLLVSLTGSAVSYLLLAGAWSVGTLFAARILAGVAGANIPVAQAYVADLTDGTERTRGMGLIGAAFGLGMVVGPALAGALSVFGPRVPELFAAGLCLVNVGLAARRLPESRAADRSWPTRFRHPLSPDSVREALAPPGAGRLIGVFFLVTLAFAVLYGTFSLAAEQRYACAQAGCADRQVAVFWVYMGLVGVVVQGWLLGRLAHRLTERNLVLAGIGALAVGFIWVPFAAHLPSLLAALALVVTGQGLASPSLSSLISRTAAVELQGGALGISQSVAAGARVLGPAGGGFIFERLGAPVPFVAAGLCSLIALGWVLFPAPAEARRQAEPLRRSG
jgi:multidrug resistance protein